MGGAGAGLKDCWLIGFAPHILVSNSQHPKIKSMSFVEDSTALDKGLNRGIRLGLPYQEETFLLKSCFIVVLAWSWLSFRH